MTARPTSALPPLRPAPTFTETIKTLAGCEDDPEAMDLLAITEWVTESHTGTELELPDGTFGHCRSCEHPWPCPQWQEVHNLTLKWLVTASITAVIESQKRIRGSV